MAHKSMSIREAVDDLNESIFLPAIQREFVWDTEQIIKLFDSVLRDYPIGSFLLWRVKDETADDQIKYKFIRNYINDSVYPDDPNFKHVDYHNPKVPTTEKLPETQKLVLDGQQRLTAFYIGLKGTYAEKKKYAQRRNASAWSNKQLYFNLFLDPDEELDDEMGLKYEFDFKRQQPEPTDNTYWFPVGDILELDPEEDVRELINELDLKDFGKDKWWVASENLRTLHNSITDSASLQYHEETTKNHERVLDIFIRTNDGGTPLSKSEILLSMATARWTEGEDGIDAREQITDFVDSLNERHEDKNFRFGIDFVLKSLLVLSDLDPQYRIANFTNHNLGVMKDTWLSGRYKDAIESALDLVVEFGLSRRSLTSYNALIPIAYYLYYQNPDLSWDSQHGMEIRRRIHYWLTSALLNGTFNSRPDEVLADARIAIQESDGSFPLEEIHRRMRGRGKVVGFSEEVVDSLLEDTTYRSQKSFLLLSLIYFPSAVRKGVDYHRDHIFPQKELEADVLVEEYGFERSVAKQYENSRHSISNLQLITEGENAGKQDKSFGEWLSSRNEEYYDRHLIPSDPDLHIIENYFDFLDKREQLIREHIKETFSEFA
ncbi:DUF262 domain-containing protein [Halalkalicoccus tibetensis]|uniref:DUF262 domain-containing protein n=1 Tax=Halalkalicoccus tibetensis TaxID=175632 RepID=A0ABD5VD27_9EURY